MSWVAALAVCAIGSASADCPADAEPPISASAEALMARLEQNFRRGPRVVRMDLRTHYLRQPSRYHAEAYQPNRRTLWGVFDGDAQETRLLYVFSGPGRLAGTTLLMHDRVAVGEADAMWLYLRSFEIFKKLEAEAQQVLVPGTALSYEDSRGFIPLDKFRFSDLPGAKAGERWILACPRSAGVREDLGYGSLRVRIDPDKQLVLGVDYADLGGRPLKSYALLRDTQLGGRSYPAEVRLEHEADGFVTQIQYAYWLPEEPPPPSLFEPGVESSRFVDRLEAYVSRIGEGERIRAELAEAEVQVRAFFERLERIQAGESPTE